jgi:hypothetical protein
MLSPCDTAGASTHARASFFEGEEGGLWAWERFNNVFNWMPLAAVIEKRVICMHGPFCTLLREHATSD